MSAISGKYAEVKIGPCEFMEFESFQADLGATTEPYNSRSGAGWTRSVEGVSSVSGTINGFLDPADPIAAQVTPGSEQTIVLRNQVGHEWSGPARLGQFSIAADRGGAPQPVSIPFTSNGPWTFPTT